VVIRCGRFGVLAADYFGRGRDCRRPCDGDDRGELGSLPHCLHQVIYLHAPAVIGIDEAGLDQPVPADHDL